MSSFVPIVILDHWRVLSSLILSFQSSILSPSSSMSVVLKLL